MQRITPFLTYKDQAEDALKFYVAAFQTAGFDAKVTMERRYGSGAHVPAGTFMTGSFSVDGQNFNVLNAGADFGFSAGVSLFIECTTQQEVDALWDTLSQGGKQQPCGWLQDKFGVSWQVVPRALGQLMGDKDPVKAGRVMQAMMKMTKLDIAGLQAAYNH